MVPNIRKRKVLFVGSFKDEAKDGSVGGQMFACKSIINSNLSNFIQWTLLDTTADSNVLTSNFNRIVKASTRIARFIYYIIFFRYDYFLIFTGGGWSFWEKGLMSIISKYFSRGKVILAPRSGFIINDISKKPVLKGFIKLVFRKANNVVCQSNYWKELFENFAYGSQHSKFVIIENMIDFDKYENIKFHDGPKNKKIAVLFLAWVTKNKGVFELVEAAKKLKNNSVPFNLTIAGKGDDFEKISNEIVLSGLSDCVTMKGWLRGKDKLKTFAQSEIFVLPTYFEGYPNSLVEAMASGKACIATKVGSIPDMIINMKNGILIEKENADELYLALKTLIEAPDLRNMISIKAREHVRKTNSTDIAIEKYINLFSN